jgi:hypothetical protein
MLCRAIESCLLGDFSGLIVIQGPIVWSHLDSQTDRGVSLSLKCRLRGPESETKAKTGQPLRCDPPGFCERHLK